MWLIKNVISRFNQGWQSIFSNSYNNGHISHFLPAKNIVEKEESFNEEECRFQSNKLNFNDNIGQSGVLLQPEAKEELYFEYVNHRNPPLQGLFTNPLIKNINIEKRFDRIPNSFNKTALKKNETINGKIWVQFEDNNQIIRNTKSYSNTYKYDKYDSENVSGATHHRIEKTDLFERKAIFRSNSLISPPIHSSFCSTNTHVSEKNESESQKFDYIRNWSNEKSADDVSLETEDDSEDADIDICSSDELDICIESTLQKSCSSKIKVQNNCKDLEQRYDFERNSENLALEYLENQIKNSKSYVTCLDKNRNVHLGNLNLSCSPKLSNIIPDSLKYQNVLNQSGIEGNYNEPIDDSNTTSDNIKCKSYSVPESEYLINDMKPCGVLLNKLQSVPQDKKLHLTKTKFQCVEYLYETFDEFLTSNRNSKIYNLSKAKKAPFPPHFEGFINNSKEEHLTALASARNEILNYSTVGTSNEILVHSVNCRNSSKAMEREAPKQTMVRNSNLKSVQTVTVNSAFDICRFRRKKRKLKDSDTLLNESETSGKTSIKKRKTLKGNRNSLKGKNIEKHKGKITVSNSCLFMSQSYLFIPNGEKDSLRCEPNCEARQKMSEIKPESYRSLTVEKKSTKDCPSLKRSVPGIQNAMQLHKDFHSFQFCTQVQDKKLDPTKTKFQNVEYLNESFDGFLTSNRNSKINKFSKAIKTPLKPDFEDFIENSKEDHSAVFASAGNEILNNTAVGTSNEMLVHSVNCRNSSKAMERNTPNQIILGNANLKSVPAVKLNSAFHICGFQRMKRKLKYSDTSLNESGTDEISSVKREKSLKFNQDFIKKKIIEKHNGKITESNSCLSVSPQSCLFLPNTENYSLECEPNWEFGDNTQLKLSETTSESYRSVSVEKKSIKGGPSSKRSVPQRQNAMQLHEDFDSFKYYSQLNNKNSNKHSEIATQLFTLQKSHCLQITPHQLRHRLYTVKDGVIQFATVDDLLLNSRQKSIKNKSNSSEWLQRLQRRKSMPVDLKNIRTKQKLPKTSLKSNS